MSAIGEVVKNVVEQLNEQYGPVPTTQIPSFTDAELTAAITVENPLNLADCKIFKENELVEHAVQMSALLAMDGIADNDGNALRAAFLALGMKCLVAGIELGKKQAQATQKNVVPMSVPDATGVAYKDAGF